MQLKYNLKSIFMFISTIMDTLFLVVKFVQTFLVNHEKITIRTTKKDGESVFAIEINLWKYSG